MQNKIFVRYTSDEDGLHDSEFKYLIDRDIFDDVF